MAKNYPDHPTWIVDHLRRSFLEALEVFPPGHLICPVSGETHPTRDAAIRRLKNYFFSQGYIVVTKGGGADRVQLRCCQLGSETQNNRKLTNETRKRQGKTQANDCPFRVYATLVHNEKHWKVGLPTLQHNHPPPEDPFEHPKTRHLHPGYKQSIHDAQRDQNRGISYRQATILPAGEDELRLTHKQFYNLGQKTKKLGSIDAADAILSDLRANNSRVALQESYELDLITGRPTKRVIDQIWCSSEEQITLARRSASRYTYIADSTFNTNSHRLLLFCGIGVSNTGKSFPIFYSFIRAEAKNAFLFADQQLYELIWREDCPSPKLAIVDQGVGFISALLEAEGVQNDERARARAQKVVFSESDDEDDNTRERRTELQLCEWHVQGAILRHITEKRGYNRKQREILHTLICDYIKSCTASELIERRQQLLNKLRVPEQQYLFHHWAPKENQFVEVYTNLLPNLGAKSTQRSESWNNSMKHDLSGQTPLHETCMRLTAQTKAVIQAVYREERRSAQTSIIALNKDMFGQLDRKVTHFALELLTKEFDNMIKWEKAVRETEIQDSTSTNAERPDTNSTALPDPLPDLDWEPQCLLSCQLPLRYGLPCKCWLYHCWANCREVPISTIDPRWIINGPPVVQDWTMSLYEGVPDSDDGLLAPLPRDRGEGDAFRNDGEQLVISTYLKAIETQKRLTAPEAIKFAAHFNKTTVNAVAEFDKRAQRQKLLPPELPQPLPTQKQLRQDARTKRVLLAKEIAEREARKRDLAEARRGKTVQQKAPERSGNARQEIPCIDLTGNDDIAGTAATIHSPHQKGQSSGWVQNEKTSQGHPVTEQVSNPSHLESPKGGQNDCGQANSQQKQVPLYERLYGPRILTRERWAAIHEMLESDSEEDRIRQRNRYQSIKTAVESSSSRTLSKSIVTSIQVPATQDNGERVSETRTNKDSRSTRASSTRSSIQTDHGSPKQHSGRSTHQEDILNGTRAHESTSVFSRNDDHQFDSNQDEARTNKHNSSKGGRSNSDSRSDSRSDSDSDSDSDTEK